MKTKARRSNLTVDHLWLTSLVVICTIAGCSSSANTSRVEDAAAGTDSVQTSPDSETSEGCDPCTYESPRNFSDIQTVEGVTVESLAGRQLPLLIRYPADASEPLPVVLWAHAGSWSSAGQKTNSDWSTAIARAGYAVVHWAAVRPTPEQLKTICMGAGVTDPAECDDQSVTGPEEVDEDFVNPFTSIAIARPADGAAILARLPKIAEKMAEMGVTLDVARPIVAGWSGGSQVVLPLAGARRLVTDSLPPYSAPSSVPAGFIALSPQGPGFSNFFADDTSTSWDDVRGPMLVITGDCDEKPANALTGAIRRLVYDHMPAGDKRLLYTNVPLGGDAAHSTFNLQSADSDDPDLAAFSATLKSTVLAFLDAHARERPEAAAWLDSNNAVEAANGKIEWLSK